MDRYFTVMLIPEREKGVRSFRIPHILFHAFFAFAVVFVILLGILSYDYWKIMQQVYQNKHLSRENRQFKEQIQLFQIKLNSLGEDLERIHVFEKKLRIITGLEQVEPHIPLHGSSDRLPAGHPREQDGELPQENQEADKIHRQESGQKKQKTQVFNSLEHLKNFKSHPKYLKLKGLYEQKIATNFGLQAGYSYTKEWFQLNKQSSALAERFAEFDYKFNTIKTFTKELEEGIHKLDQHLLDRDSRMRSTPTLFPAKGWITSYYGPRVSPTSGRLRMHEGLDIGARPGTPIVAPADGRVVYSGTKPGFGKFLQIDHGYGIESFYAHNSKLRVRKGQSIQRGEHIADIGSTGSSTGPHLHYEIRVNGTPVDPLYYVLN